MSSSVFKEYSPPNNGKIDSNLVILVNKFGNVTVDQTALHNLLGNYKHNKINSRNRFLKVSINNINLIY